MRKPPDNVCNPLPLRRLLAVQMPQRPVQLQLLLGQQRQPRMVAFALGLGDLRPQLALAALNRTLLNLLQCTLHLARLRRPALAQQRLRQQRSLARILHRVHRVFCRPTQPTPA